MGFGATPQDALASPMASLLGAGFKASVRMIVDAMGFAGTGPVRTIQEVAVATAPIDSPIGEIQPGQVAARRFRWEAEADGRPVVTAAVNWLMGEDHLDPGWTFGPAGHRFEIEITGDPGMLVTFTGLHPGSVADGLIRNPGVVATANHCVNSIPYVCRAEPGIKTYLDLPLISRPLPPRRCERERAPSEPPGAAESWTRSEVRATREAPRNERPDGEREAE